MLEITALQIAMVFVGVGIGLIFGALPGLTATMAVACFLPFTYAYDLATSLYLLIGLYVGGINGGLIPSILINIPGTPSSICTVFDGYPMARRGEAVRALRIAITSSLIGGVIGLICLWLFAPPLARLALSFSAVEKFLIILFALSIVAALSKGNMITGVFMGFLGVLVSLVGAFADNNTMRMVPGFLRVELRGGIPLLPVIIGLFAFVQMMEEAEKGMKDEKFSLDLQHQTKNFSIRDFADQKINTLRSGLLGVFIGVLPGIGGSAASLLSYSQSKNFSKHPEQYGTGYPGGVIASETANSGMIGGALVPVLSLGIPGDSTTAVMMGAFMLQGVQLGPLFLSNHISLWRSILIAVLIATIIMFIIMFYPIKYISKIIQIPKNRIYPAVILLCTIGAFTSRNGNMFDVWITVVFGICGYIFTKLKLPVVPFLIGFILGGDLEKYFVDSIKGSGGSLLPFFTRPMAWVIWFLILLSIGWAIYDNIRTKKGNRLNLNKAIQ
ncbi:MAG: tripartite tricarboxylate transporter permease [Treponema sp.]|nr:tripartite tricarboxylate transporter permease [Treponema sp.]